VAEVGLCNVKREHIVDLEGDVDHSLPKVTSPSVPAELHK
jgi:hypothetical protein